MTNLNAAPNYPKLKGSSCPTRCLKVGRQYDLCDHRGLIDHENSLWQTASTIGPRWWKFLRCRDFVCLGGGTLWFVVEEAIPTELILVIQHGDRLASMEHTIVIYCSQTMRVAEPWLGKLLDYLGAANGGRCGHSIQPKIDMCHSVHLSLRQNMFVYIYAILTILYIYYYIYIV